MFANQIVTLIAKTRNASDIIRRYGSSWTVISAFNGLKAPCVYVYSNAQYHGHNTTLTVFVQDDPDYAIQE